MRRWQARRESETSDARPTGGGLDVIVEDDASAQSSRSSSPAVSAPASVIVMPRISTSEPSAPLPQSTGWADAVPRAASASASYDSNIMTNSDPGPIGGSAFAAVDAVRKSAAAAEGGGLPRSPLAPPGPTPQPQMHRQQSPRRDSTCVWGKQSPRLSRNNSVTDPAGPLFSRTGVAAGSSGLSNSASRRADTDIDCDAPSPPGTAANSHASNTPADSTHAFAVKALRPTPPQGAHASDGDMSDPGNMLPPPPTLPPELPAAPASPRADAELIAALSVHDGAQADDSEGNDRGNASDSDGADADGGDGAGVSADEQQLGHDEIEHPVTSIWSSDSPCGWAIMEDIQEEDEDEVTAALAEDAAYHTGRTPPSRSRQASAVEQAASSASDVSGLRRTSTIRRDSALKATRSKDVSVRRGSLNRTTSSHSTAADGAPARLGRSTSTVSTASNPDAPPWGRENPSMSDVQPASLAFAANMGNSDSQRTTNETETSETDQDWLATPSCVPPSGGGRSAAPALAKQPPAEPAKHAGAAAGTVGAAEVDKAGARSAAATDGFATVGGAPEPVQRTSASSEEPIAHTISVLEGTPGQGGNADGASNEHVLRSADMIQTELGVQRTGLH